MSGSWSQIEFPIKIPADMHDNPHVVFVYFATIVSILLTRYSQQKGILVEIPFYDTGNEASRRNLPLSLPMDDCLSFSENFRNVKDALLNAYQHQEFLLASPMIALPTSNVFLYSDVLHENHLPSATSELIFALLEVDNEHTLAIDYKSEFFEQKFIDNVVNHFNNVGSLRGNNTPAGEIEFLTNSEKQLIASLDPPVSPESNDTIISLFRKSVAQNGDKVAIRVNDNIITYTKLDRLSDNLAARVSETKGEIIGIYLDRSERVVIVMLAILKSGKGYLFLDPRSPVERLEWIKKDSGVRTIVTRSDLVSYLHGDGDVILIEDCIDESNAFGNEILPIVDPTVLAYVIYTSGTTGRPKGVRVTHGNVANLVGNIPFDFSTGQTWSVCHSFAFDFSVWEIFASLASGGSLVIASDEIIRDPKLFCDFLVGNKVTVLSITPLAFNNLLIASLPVPHLMLEYVIFGGDILHPSTLGLFKQAYPATSMINMYGITETTVHVTYHVVTSEDIATNKSIIGHPLPGYKTLVLDSQMRSCPLGVTGELYVGGRGVAVGYHNNERLTRSHFIDSIPGIAGRFYRSGDLVRIDFDGELVYIGRGDRQVKIRGHRIELNEITAVLRKYPELEDVFVGARRNEGELDTVVQVIAYCVSREAIDVNKIITFLKRYLPEYMIPSHFIQVELIPLNKSGKVDVRALPVPQISLATGEPSLLSTSANETILIKAWSHVLRIGKPGLDQNFFELGGDSIKAIQVASFLTKEGFKVNIKDLYENQTIRLLAPLVTVQRALISQAPITGTSPLSPIQAYFHGFTDKSHYNQAVALQLRQTLDPSIVETVFAALARQHDALRITYAYKNGSTVQENHGIDHKSVDVMKCEVRNEEEYKTKIDELHRTFDLEKGPLVRVRLFQFTERPLQVLFIVAHQTVIDGVSWRILLTDFEDYYRSLSEGKDIKYSPKTFSFLAWCQWIGSLAAHYLIRRQIHYWAAIETTNVRSVFQGSADQWGNESQVDTINVKWDKEITSKLTTEANKALYTDTDDILLSALGISLSAWSSNHVFKVMLEGHGRSSSLLDADLSRTVGKFTVNFPVLIEVHPDSIRDTIVSVKEMRRRVPTNGIGYGILRYLSKDSGISYSHPEINFNFLGDFDGMVDTALFADSGLTTGSWISSNSEIQYLLDFNGLIINGELQFSVRYSRLIYSSESIARLADFFKRSLESIVEWCSEQSAERTPSDYGDPLLPDSDLKLILAGVAEYFSSSTIKKIYRLSHLQRGILFHYLADPASRSYVLQFTLKLQGNIDAELLKRACLQLVERHDVLRTVFFYEGLKEQRQVVLESLHVPIKILNASGLGLAQQETYIRLSKQSAIEAGINIQFEPPLNITIIKCGELVSIILTIHHIVIDGWSLQLLGVELMNIYSGHAGDTRKPQYSQYIEWLSTLNNAQQSHYWAEYLKGIQKPCQLESKNSKDINYEKREIQFEIDRQVIKRLEDLALQRQVSLSSLFHGSWAVVLHMYTGCTDIVFGTVVTGRPADVNGIETMIGAFINTVPLRVKIDHDSSVWDVFRGIHHDIFKSEQFHQTPLSDILELTNRDLVNNIVDFHNYPASRFFTDEITRSVKIINADADEQSNFGIHLMAFLDEDMRVVLRYNFNQYDEAFMNNLLNNIKTCIRFLLEDNRTVGELLTKMKC